MTSGRTGHWTKMHQSLVKFSESEASNHTPSLADFTTTTPELKFSVHTGLEMLVPQGFSRSLASISGLDFTTGTGLSRTFPRFEGCQFQRAQHPDHGPGRGNLLQASDHPPLSQS